jgi:hypothetical protein
MFKGLDIGGLRGKDEFVAVKIGSLTDDAEKYDLSGEKRPRQD